MKIVFEIIDAVRAEFPMSSGFCLGLKLNSSDYVVRPARWCGCSLTLPSKEDSPRLTRSTTSSGSQSTAESTLSRFQAGRTRTPVRLAFPL